MNRRSILLAMAGVVLAGLLPLRNARADVTFVVDNVVDRIDDNTADGLCHTSAGTCSLRAAIMQANHLDVPAVRIEVPAGTYTITIPRSGADFDAEDSGDLDMKPLNGNQRVFIHGAGAANTIIDGNHTERVLFVSNGARTTIARLTIRNGATLSGGGISNFGELTVLESVVEGNEGADGGGIYSSGTLTVERSTIRSNIATRGGGLYLTGPSRLRGSTVHNNGANDGGGIHATSQPLYLVNSTVSTNYANTNGGGIYSAGTTSLYNASVINNDADHDRDENGGIGGGVYVASGTFGISNTLIAQNTILDAPIDDDCNGFVVAFGWNLFGETDGCAFGGMGAASVGRVSASTIGPLQANGGPTSTHALLAGSQAIDTVFAADGCYDENLARLSIDQRGALRPAGARCDVGAYEYDALFDVLFQDGFQH
ncbi:choice-of-anchor Q domain-containing protein [Dokdonella sp.]|uniref:choice-of-anchor Q domain-containing protein n=1 Tax=Dokdonella sp. TaxID=2291710 RepID=UPI00378484ED